MLWSLLPFDEKGILGFPKDLTDIKHGYAPIHRLRRASHSQRIHGIKSRRREVIRCRLLCFEQRLSEHLSQDEGIRGIARLGLRDRSSRMDVRYIFEPNQKETSGRRTIENQINGAPCGL